MMNSCACAALAAATISASLAPSRPSAIFSRIVPRNRCTILADIGDLAAQRGARHRGDVLAVDQNAAAIDCRRSAKSG